MKENELIKVAQKLSESGMADHLKDGQQAIPVSLMMPGHAGTGSRVERKAYLQKEFSQKLNGWIGKGLEVDFDTLSISGQSVNAKVGIQNIKPLLQYFATKNLQVYPNVKMNVV